MPLDHDPPGHRHDAPGSQTAKTPASFRLRCRQVRHDAFLRARGATNCGVSRAPRALRLPCAHDGVSQPHERAPHRQNRLVQLRCVIRRDIQHPRRHQRAIVDRVQPADAAVLEPWQHRRQQLVPPRKMLVRNGKHHPQRRSARLHLPHVTELCGFQSAAQLQLQALQRDRHADPVCCVSLPHRLLQGRS